MSLPSSKPRIGKRIADIQDACDESKRLMHSPSASSTDRAASSTNPYPDADREPLVEFLLGLYNDGILSTRHLQHGAQAALSMMNVSKESRSMLVELSRLGHQGAYEGNMYRDFMRRIGSKGKMPDLYEAVIPSWDIEGCKPKHSKMYFMLPHELLPRLCGDNVPEWSKFDASTASWEGRLAQWCARTGAPRGDDLVSLGIWGDAAPYNTRDSLYVVLWNVISGPHRTRYWLTCWPKKAACKCGCHGRHSLEAIWEIVGWSLRCLFLGRYPSTRHDGTPFNNATGDRKRARQNGELGVRGACMQLRGDWSWLKEAFDLQDWAQGGASKGVCFKCPANCGNLDWKDSTLQAAWRSVPRTTHQSFMTDRLLRGGFISKIWNFPGVELDCISLDLMHIADLGVTQYVLGSLMWEFFLHVGGLVSKPRPGCGVILTLIRHFSKHLGVESPINNLTISMFRPSAAKAVRFKGKAAECRHLLPIMMEILRVAMPNETAHEALRYNCCKALSSVYWEITHWSDGAADRAIDHGRRFNILYMELAREQFHSTGSLLVWRPTPKFHLLNHCLEEMKVSGSAAAHWCYPDERSIGRAAKIAETSHASTVNKTCMQKFKCWELC
jgi:hypothetical protein